MRKLKLQVQTSVDGFIAGQNGEMDWITWNWDDKIKNYINELTEPVDTILLGRKLATGFIPHWTDVTTKPEDPSFEFGKKMVTIPKVVFSKTLNKSDWKNTLIAKGDLKNEVKKMKNQNGRDIIVYGGASFVSSLIKEGLIDEYHLFMNPAAIGSGMSIFGDVNGKLNLKLIKSIPFDCGIALMHYEPKKDN